MARTYFIRTFGCQMNEHDSERLAGLLVADGMEPAAAMEDADVVVLNTCCIRENADQRLYGTLGRLKELVDAKPGLQIAVGGCLAQKDRERIQEKVGWVDVVFGTHNLTRAPGAAAPGPRPRARVMEILDAPDARGGDQPARSAPAPSASCRTRPGSTSRPAATTPAPSASCRRCGAPR